MDTTTVYAPILKHFRDDNGDLVVFGKATGPDLDLDQQICDPEWLKTAMPTWFQWGNLREQHPSIAAGTAKALTAEGDSWNVEALVVDKGSAEKVEKGVLKGYSIGISNPRVVKDAAAPGGRIVGGQIVEVSLVDRPCNPTAMLSLAKAAKPGATMKAFAFDPERMLVKVEEFEEHPDGEDVLTVERAEDAGASAKTDDAEPAAETTDKSVTPPPLEVARVALGGIVPGTDWVGLTISGTGDGVPADLGEVVAKALAARYMTPKAEEDDSELTEITIPLAAAPDSTKTPASADTARKTADAGPDLTELVNKAVAEAMRSSEERTKALEAELAKVKALPVPGGPVLTRTAEDTQKAAAKDAVLAKATHFRQLADAVTDPAARMGYLELAAQAEKLA